MMMSDVDRVDENYNGPAPWESFNYLSDALVMCSHQGDGDGAYGHGISMYNGTSVRRRLFGTVQGWVGGTANVSLQGMHFAHYSHSAPTYSASLQRLRVTSSTSCCRLARITSWHLT